MAKGWTRVTPLGGLGEVGKNMTVVESEGGIVVIDAGLSFPRDEHLGVDLVLPDFGPLEDRRDKIRAVILTHGHEDHVGALPYFLREIGAPEIWATKLTLGLVKSKLDEHGLTRTVEMIEAVPEDAPVDIGPFKVQFVRMAHSIPDAVAVVLDTPGGRIVFTGDYKIDHTPVDGFRTDVGRLAEIGNEGVDLLLGDSTNAERPGTTASERTVGEAFRHDHPASSGPGAHRVVRVEHPPRPAGDRRRDRDEPPGRADRPLAAQEREHLPQPRLPRRARGDPRQARRPRQPAARGDDDLLHGQPGRADGGA